MARTPSALAVAAAVFVAALCLLSTPAEARRSARKLQTATCEGGDSVFKPEGSTAIACSTTIAKHDTLATTSTFCFSGGVGNSFDLWVKDGNGGKLTGADVIITEAARVSPAPIRTASCTGPSLEVCKLTVTRADADSAWAVPVIDCKFNVPDGKQASECIKVESSANGCIVITNDNCKPKTGTANGDTISHVTVGNVECCTCTTYNWPTPSDGCKGAAIPDNVAITTNCGNTVATLTSSSPKTLSSCGTNTFYYTATCPTGVGSSTSPAKTAQASGGTISWYEKPAGASPVKADLVAGLLYTSKSAVDTCPNNANAGRQLVAIAECDATLDAENFITPVATTTSGTGTCAAKKYTYTYQPTCNTAEPLKEETFTFKDDIDFTADGCKYKFKRCTESEYSSAIPATGNVPDYANCKVQLTYANVVDACGVSKNYGSKCFSLVADTCPAAK